MGGRIAGKIFDLLRDQIAPLFEPFHEQGGGNDRRTGSAAFGRIAQFLGNPPTDCGCGVRSAGRHFSKRFQLICDIEAGRQRRYFIKQLSKIPTN